MERKVRVVQLVAVSVQVEAVSPETKQLLQVGRAAQRAALAAEVGWWNWKSNRQWRKWS